MKDARIAALTPLLKRADRKQLGAMAALIADSFGLQAVVAAAGSGAGDSASSPPPPELPEPFRPPLKFMDVHGNSHENWFDYMQATTNGDFGAITGLTRDDWEPW